MRIRFWGVRGSIASPGPDTAAVGLGMTLEEATRRYVSATLDACDGTKAEAAQRLEIGRNTIGRMFSRDSDPGADGDE